MDKLITTLLNLTGSGWKGYVGGAVAVLVSIGLFADYFGQMIGFDFLAEETTLLRATELFSVGLTLLGIRHKQSKQDETILAATSATEEQTSATEDLTDALESMPKKK